MKQYPQAKLFLVLTALALTWFVVAGAAAEQNEFVGVAKCKTCHNKASSGMQWDQWSKTPHAQAFTVLASEAALAIAKEKGIADPQQADACLKCHVTAHGVDAKFVNAKFAKEDGVGCESCHGAGGAYWKMTVMKDLTAGKVDPATVGLVKPTKELCVQCHNEESPTFKAFNFEEAIKVVAHPIPAEHKATYKK
ncbi:MAG TPA: cytochrome c family protein [Candidatus Krumholzibacteria bacterium]|nr:cytochrome c family protein [Candidatus Krumholzibacteria bacterium]HPD72500.1 cytochrome c family protein [Candidatus Krumholzibacteria bacterium]HRY40568.1 cytochrome c family protein [Candidatus Krumholzibacteria bacterium]